MSGSPRGPTEGPFLLDLRAVEADAAVLDDPQLKRLGGVILSLDLAYVAAVQYAPEHMRALLAHCRALRAALTELTYGEGHHAVTCGIPRECTCGQDRARAVLAQAQDAN